MNTKSLQVYHAATVILKNTPAFVYFFVKYCTADFAKHFYMLWKLPHQLL